MTTRRNRPAAAAEEDAGWRHLLSVGLPIGCVVGVLILGAALRVDPDPAGSLTFAASGEVEVVGGLEPLPPAIPTTAPPADRRAADLDRLATSGDRWTAQLAMLCDEAGARRLAARFPDAHELYLLPVDHGGNECWAVCWGIYGGAEQARAANDLPPALRDEHRGFFPKQIDALLQERR
jgi:hypothetical protein